MIERKLLRNIGLVFLALVILFSAAVILFFAEGGEIYGFNHDPNNPGPNVLTQGDIVFVPVPVDEEIIPIYDDEEVIKVELWELPPRDILVRLITAPMAIIPPTTSYLISILYLLSGFAFCGAAFSVCKNIKRLYTAISARKDIKRNQEPGARPEQILTYITDHPCHSQQQIADGTGIPRSSLRHYLRRLQDNKKIKVITYNRTPYYLPYADSYTSTEKLVLVILSREKEHRFFAALAENPGIEKTDLADMLTMNARTTQWYLSRLKKSGLLMKTPKGDLRCFLTMDAANAYQKLGKEA